MLFRSPENQRRLIEEDLLRLRGKQLVSTRSKKGDQTEKAMIQTIESITKQPERVEHKTDMDVEQIKQPHTGSPKKDQAVKRKMQEDRLREQAEKKKRIEDQRGTTTKKRRTTKNDRRSKRRTTTDTRRKEKNDCRS